MKYTAIIFDLFGTLIGDFSRTRYEDVYVCMARAVQLPSDVFRHAFGQTFHDRTIGQYASIEQNIAHVCTQLGMSPTARNRSAGSSGSPVCVYAQYPHPKPRRACRAGRLETRWIPSRVAQ